MSVIDKFVDSHSAISCILGRNQKQRKFQLKNGESRNSCRVKVGGVGVEGMMTFKNLEYLRETGIPDSM